MPLTINNDYMDVSKNSGKPPKWMVKIMENPKTLFFNGWFGGTHNFRKHPHRQNHPTNFQPIRVKSLSILHQQQNVLLSSLDSLKSLMKEKAALNLDFLKMRMGKVRNIFSQMVVWWWFSLVKSIKNRPTNSFCLNPQQKGWDPSPKCRRFQPMKFTC